MTDPRLTTAIETTNQLIHHLASRPSMYVKEEDHYYAIENMINQHLFIWSALQGHEGVDWRLQRKYLLEQYPGVPGSVRCVATGVQHNGLDFTEEMLKFIAWYQGIVLDHVSA